MTKNRLQPSGDQPENHRIHVHPKAGDLIDMINIPENVNALEGLDEAAIRNFLTKAGYEEKGFGGVTAGDTGKKIGRRRAKTGVLLLGKDNKVRRLGVGMQGGYALHVVVENADKPTPEELTDISLWIARTGEQGEGIRFAAFKEKFLQGDTIERLVTESREKYKRKMEELEGEGE